VAKGQDKGVGLVWISLGSACRLFQSRALNRRRDRASEGELQVASLDGLTLQVKPVPGGDLDELMEVTGRLREELLDLDVDAVDPVSEETAPEHAKGLGSLAGWLVVQLGTVGGLRAVVDVVRGWAARTNRVVEVSWGGEVLKVTGVTSAQQEKIIDAWLARNAAGT
jgi:hypothetical protein